MVNQNESPDGIPRKNPQRPSPDVERYATDGQTNAPGRGASDEQAAQPPRASERPLERRTEPYADEGRRTEPYEGEGPGKVGLTSSRQPDLVAPSGVNERDHGAAEDKPLAGGAVNLDDFDEDRPRGDTRRTGGTWKQPASDAGAVGPAPHPGLSDRNNPSDPNAKRDPRPT